MNSGDPANDTHSARIPLEPSSEPSLRSIRIRIDELLPGDEDLSAFLLDDFPEVHRELSAEMTRTRRVNLLFEKVPPQESEADSCTTVASCSAVRACVRRLASQR